MRKKTKPPNKINTKSEPTKPAIYKKERVLNTRFQKIIQSPYRELIEDAVYRSNHCFENTLFFAKLLLTKHYQDTIVEFNGYFSHEFATKFSTEFKIDKIFFENLLTIVSCDSIDKRRGKPFASEKAVFMKQLKSRYDSYVESGILHLVEGIGKNLSHVFKLLAIQMETSYKNNIMMHYDKYLKRIIRGKVEKYVITQFNYKSYYDVPNELKKETTVTISKMIRLFFKSKKDDDLDNNMINFEEWQQLIISQVYELIPKGMQIYDWVDNPDSNIYLPYMIFMSHEMETLNKKMLNPFPMRSGYIPGSITVNTSALIDILITKDVFIQLKCYLELTENYHMEKITNKGHLYDDVTKLIDNVENAEKFKTSIWNFFIKDSKKLVYRDLVFNNCITTDGHKIGLHYTNRETFGKTKWMGHSIRPLLETKKYDYVTQLSQDIRNEYLDESKFIRIYVDPGKGGLIEAGTGVKSGPRLRYSARQRRFESTQKRNNEEYLQSVKRIVPGTNNITYETIITRNYLPLNHKSIRKETGLKSCYYSNFYNYLENRGNFRRILSEMFQHSRHRRNRYRVKIGMKKSEQLLINNIKKTFDSENSGKKIILFWGNWGRNPNITNQPPSPGIGLRNRVAKLYETVTVDERYTSSICPHCDSEVDHPKKDRNGKDIHHLLRCKNENCGRWWQRDVMAVANFKRQVEHGLHFAINNPVFTSKYKEQNLKRKREESAIIQREDIL